MVLGRETKGWSYPGQIGSLTEYVRVGMNKHRDFPRIGTMLVK